MNIKCALILLLLTNCYANHDLLYSPYRSLYRDIANIKTDDCPFCTKFDLGDDQKYEHLIVRKTKHSVIMLNKFPYNAGHLLVMPIRHTADLLELSEEEYIDLFKTVGIAIQATKAVNKTVELNVGLNIGKSSGGSVPSHSHIHLIPRYLGDTNFLAVMANTKVIMRDNNTVYDEYIKYFAEN